MSVDTKYLEVLRERLKSATDHIAAYEDMTAAIKTTQQEQQQLAAWIDEQQPKLDALIAKLDSLYPQLKEKQDQINAKTFDSVKATASLQATLKAVNERLGMLDKTAAQMFSRDFTQVAEDAVNQLAAAKDTLETCDKEATRITAAINQEGSNKNKLMFQLRDQDSKLASLAEALNTVVDAKQKLADSVFHDGTDLCVLCGHRVYDQENYIKQTLWLVGYDDIETTDVWDAPFNKRIAELQQQQQQLQEQSDATATAIKTADLNGAKLQKELTANYALQQETQLQHDFLVLMTEHLELIKQKASLEESIAAAGDSSAYDALKHAADDLAAEISRGEGYKQALASEIVSAKAKIDAKQEYITRLQSMQEQAEVNNSAREMLMLLRDVFSQQRAQARYLAYKAEELNRHLSSFMERTGMPFRLYLDKDSRVFKYTSEGGFEHPTAHLSGAQKNISAVALQMALVEVINPNINLFLFDEPSESLDTENKIVMSELFKRMNRMLSSIGGTMLIVSRDEPLIEACENIININSREETLK